MKKVKFSRRFRDWHIRTKLIVMMMFLAWLPLGIAMGAIVTNMTEVSILRMENELLGLVSDTVGEMEVEVVDIIRDSLGLIRDASNKDAVVAFLAGLPQAPEEFLGGGGEGDSSTVEEDCVPPEGETLPPTPEGGPPENGGLGEGGGPPPTPEGGPPGDGPPPGGSSPRFRTGEGAAKVNLLPVLQEEDCPPPLEEGEEPPVGEEGEPPGPGGEDQGQQTVDELDLTDEQLSQLEQIDVLLRELVESEYIGNATVYDTYGIVRHSTDPNLRGEDFSEMDFILESLAGRNFMTDIEIGRSGEDAGFFISAPVFDDDDVVIGGIFIRLHADFILESVKDILTEDGETSRMNIYLVNQYKILIADGNEREDWKFNSLGELTEQEIAALRESGVMGEVVPDFTSGLQSLGDALAEGFVNGEGVDNFEYCLGPDVFVDAEDYSSCNNGAKHRVAYEPLINPITDEIMFMIVVDVDVDQSIKEVQGDIRLYWSVAVIAGALFFVVVVWIAGSISKPIRRLAAVAEEVEQEIEFDPKTLEDMTKADDEIGHLTKTFSKMVVAMQERERQLKSQVQELKIKINQIQRKKDVEEIQQGEFYQDLKAKAKEVRKKQKGEGKAEEEGETKE